jgi:hypothetical protein
MMTIPAAGWQLVNARQPKEAEGLIPNGMLTVPKKRKSTSAR